jgi:hypothetical protein
MIIVVEKIKDIVLKENVFVKMDTQAHLVVIKHVLIHVLIMENALKGNVNVILVLKELTVLFKYVLMNAQIKEYVQVLLIINVFVMKVL